LPPHPTENLEEIFEPARKIRSRRFPTKVMYMGIVAPPDLDMLFDGKIMMKRVSKQVLSKACSYNTKFSQNYHINQLIKSGEWKTTCFMDSMLPWQLFEAIGETYDLEDYITFDMVCSYRTYTTVRSKKTKVVRLDRKFDKTLSDVLIRPVAKGRTRPLTIEDITLHVRVERGSTRESDVNCDNTFMMDTIHEIGKAIRDKMDHVPVWEPIHLFIDNAGGHGTNKGKEEYEKILHDDYFVILNWQVPNSPEMNMLDLGAWMTIQSVVEKLHRQRLMDEDALANTIKEAFVAFDGYTKLDGITRRWELVLDLILDDSGGNDLVEIKRGVLTKPLIGSVLLQADIDLKAPSLNH
jgi:hypothetical protein